MDGPVRVTFRFGRDVQVHHMTELPEPGDLVTHVGELWAVWSLEEGAVGKVTVVCNRRPGGGSHLYAVKD